MILGVLLVLLRRSGRCALHRKITLEVLSYLLSVNYIFSRT